MLETIEENGKLYCRFHGPLNAETCKQMAETLHAKIGASSLPVVFDLKNVDFIASAFFRICMVAARQRGTEKLEVINLSPLCRRLFKIAGLDAVLTLH